MPPLREYGKRRNMTAALALAVMALQATPPALSPGASVDFSRAALAVEAKLVAGDVPGAREAARTLPRKDPRIAWVGLDRLPANLQEFRPKAIQTVSESWARRVRGLSLQEGGDAPDVVIELVPSLPEGADGLPEITKIERGVPLKATIALTRGKPAVPITNAEFVSEIEHALGVYFGVSESPFYGTPMHRDPRPGVSQYHVKPIEATLAQANVVLSDQLRAAIESGKPSGLKAAAVELITPKLEFGEVLQGTPLQGFLELKNPGVGPLDFWVEPDCGCFRPMAPGQIPPGGTQRVQIRIDTSEFMGTNHKRLALHSNDPSQPVIEIPVSFSSKPAYRMFRPGGEYVVVPDSGGTFDVFLFFPAGSNIKVTSVGWEGTEAKVTSTPWQGPLADPDMAEGALPRKGYRFRVRMSPDLIPGRNPGTLIVRTDSPTFSELRYSMYAQKGIVAVPDNVFAGDLTVGARFSFLVSRPNAPFKVKGVDGGPFKATWKEVRSGWEYQVDLVYEGGAPKGDIATTVKVTTDDPKQPTVEALVTGNVK